MSVKKYIMREIDPQSTSTRDLHQFLLGCVSPRPIALASTIDNDGNPNLAPFSFFNAFSSNPPIVVFSANRRVVDNTTKHTLNNIIANKEVVINMVSHEIVRQMTITSIDFPEDTNEFVKSGFTPIESDIVKPYRVKESPAQLECKVNDIITLGTHGGAGHLIICEVVKMHVSEDVIDDNNRIDPDKIDLMGRLGRSYYTRASGEALSSIIQPVMKITIGYDQLPEFVKHHTILSANDIAMFSGMETLPTNEEVADFIKNDSEVKNLLAQTITKSTDLVLYAKELLTQEKRKEAMMIMLYLGEKETNK